MQKIMIVEDDEIIASSIKKHLEKWNYDVRVVNDFENVLEDFRNYEPLLILLDISLPYYNGYYWCQEIRKECLKLSITHFRFIKRCDQLS